MSDIVEPSTTRERILRAARQAFLARGFNASMAEIAKSAGVSRQALYLLFGDRTGLLTALTINDAGKEPTVSAMRAALTLPPLDAFEGFFRNWIRTALAPSMRVFWRQAQGAPKIMAFVKTGDERFYHNYHQLFGKLHRARVLRPIWTSKEAADAAYATTLYGVFVEHLRNMRGWSDDEIEERGMKVLRATFLTDGAAKRAAEIHVPRA